VSRFVVLAILVAMLPRSAVRAQESRTSVALTVSPSFVNFETFGGSFGAFVAGLGISRDFSRGLGGELAGFVLAPLGGSSSQPECPAGTPCGSRSTPSLLSGVLASALFYVGESGLQASLGAGIAAASGGEGLEHTSSAAGSIGLGWTPRGSTGLAPTLAVRVVQLATPLAGARTLLLPGIGLAF